MQPPILQPAQLGYYTSDNPRASSTAILFAWLALLIGLIAVLCDTFMLGATFLDTNGYMRIYQSNPIFVIRIISYSAIGLIEHALLAVAGILALARSGFARHMLFAYIGAGIFRSILAILFGILETFRGRGPMGAAQSVVQCSASLAYILFLVLVIVILCQPPVRELFTRSLTRPARPPHA